ncbi:MAG: alkaline phosphatase family protein [Thermoanaerobaculia bacterium]|nr:alkaline phosphatase family protein [Thermoanaerobaculia bacterium]
MSLPSNPRAVGISASIVPGAIFGAHLAALLWFLNPELPVAPGPMIRAALFYAGLGGVGSLILLAPIWGGRRPGRALRLLPWLLSLVLLVDAGLYALQASHFAFYLPAGINTRLLKAASWLGLGSLISMYTALVHTWNRRPYGLRSRIGLWVVALGSLIVVVERREAYRPQPEATSASAVGQPRNVTLFVVGLDGASPDAVLPLAEQGHLPFFDRILREGTLARLPPLDPSRTLPSWVTLATGKLPFGHGIVGARVYEGAFLPTRSDLELLPAGLLLDRWGGLIAARTPDASKRRARTLWEILPRLGVPSGAVGWPSLTPTTAPLLFGFDDRFFQGEQTAATSPQLRAPGTLFRVEERDLDTELLDQFPVSSRSVVSGSLAQDRWRSTLALALADRHPSLAALFLRLPGLDRVSRLYFDGYAAHILEGRPGAGPQESLEVIRSYYRYLDGVLEQAWRLRDGPRLLVVVSPRGTRSAAPWHRLLRNRPPARQDPEADGLLLVLGEGLRTGAFLAEVRPEDLVPTILYGLGLPLGRDLDGRVRTGAWEPAFVARHPVAFIPSYDTLSEGE